MLTTFDSNMIGLLPLWTGLPKCQVHISPLGVMCPATVVALWKVLWHCQERGTVTLHPVTQHSH